jgi:hypothetical protein
VPYDGPTLTKLGRYQVVPSMRPDRLHVTTEAAALKEVEHDIPIPVLDQEDLHKQGIDVTQLVPGAQDTDALGSCTCQSGTAHAAERWTAAGRDLTDLKLFGYALSGTDPVQDEKAAILLYHAVTDQTGDPSQEWPPTDCGSSGYYVCTELERLGVASSYRSGSGVLGALSLLQAGTVMQGSPWFNAWFTPDSQGFVDGDGSRDALQAAMASGVAGGHETLQYAIVQLALTSAGTVDLANTVIKVRNSWSTTFGLSGDYLIHASTLDMLAQYTDFKQAVIGAPAPVPPSPQPPAPQPKPDWWAEFIKWLEQFFGK